MFLLLNRMHGQVTRVNDLLEFLITDMPGFIQAPELLEVVERNQLRTILIAKPIGRMYVIELVKANVIRALVQRFSNLLNENHVVESQRRSERRSIQERVFA